MAQARREYRTVESRLLAEYLASQWPDCQTRLRVRVGQIAADASHPDLAPEEVRALGVWRRWADAVIWDRPRIYIVEAGIIPQPGKVSQLDLYLRLFPHTPEFAEYGDWELRGRLVHAVHDPIVQSLALERGLFYDIFDPPWVATYLSTLLARKRRAPTSPL